MSTTHPSFPRPRPAASARHLRLVSTKPESRQHVIDCDTCVMQFTDACDDCVMSFLCRDDAESSVELDGDELRAMSVLSESGLLPKLRHVPRSGAAS